jgi:hypothetical protein
VSDSFCPACQAAIRTAEAALDVLNDVDASDEDRRIAAEELARAGDHLRPPIGPRADEETERR